MLVSNVRHQMFDGHLVFSTMLRPAPSRFTRVQRLVCAGTVVFLMMITNIMFFDTETNVTSGGVTIGPLKITPTTVFSSVFSALIMVPVALVLTFIFRKRKLREEKTGGQGILPWWTIFLAYFLAFAVTSVSAFFTVLYSLQFGVEKSSQWLFAFFVSGFLNIFVTDPLKVVVIAMILSWLLRPPKTDSSHSSTDRTRPDVGLGVRKVVERLAGMNAKVTEERFIKYKFVDPPENGLEADGDRDKRMQQEEKAQNLLKSIVAFIFFLVIQIIIAVDSRPQASFHLNQHLRSVVNTGNFSSVSNFEEYFRWLRSHAFPNLFPTSDTNGAELNEDLRRFLLTPENLRLGPPVLRQFRTRGTGSPSVINGTCRVPQQVLDNFPQMQCFVDYTSTPGSLGMRNYNTSWREILNGGLTGIFGARGPFSYQTAADLNTETLVGDFGSYEGGSYAPPMGSIADSWPKLLQREVFEALVLRQTSIQK